jgi:putative transcriptional regulator
VAIKYKTDIIAALKNKGFSTYRIRKEKLIGESTLQKIRNGELVSWENIDTICELLDCQPGDILEYVPESQDSGSNEPTKE